MYLRRVHQLLRTAHARRVHEARRQRERHVEHQRQLAIARLHVR